MGKSKTVLLTRREFLKFAGLQLAALAAPIPWFEGEALQEAWSRLRLDWLSIRTQEILARLPDLALDQAGYLSVRALAGRSTGYVPVAQTLWNQERRSRVDRLRTDVPWGIVLHWYGDRESFDRSVTGYLRGFDDLRPVGTVMTRTSAHFLVGDSPVKTGTQGEHDPIGILQTQTPDSDGIPFLGSHIQPLNFEAHRDRQQYFVRALYQLSFQEPAAHNLLQDLFDGPRLDPNMRTIAIEIAGYDFERPEGCPSTQKVANVVDLVWALMKRYNISARGLLGHNEIQLGKPDPGKKFMATVRFLIGLKAMLTDDEHMRRLVFGPFLEAQGGWSRAARKYFKFGRDYLTLVGRPNQVYDWEAESGFWFLDDQLCESEPNQVIARAYRSPVHGKPPRILEGFTQPVNHAGMDLCEQELEPTGALVASLVADGVCLYAGESHSDHLGKLAMFRHRQPDGAQVVSTFGHLGAFGGMQAGRAYPLGYPIGARLDYGHARFLHFAVAYGAT